MRFETVDYKGLKLFKELYKTNNCLRWWPNYKVLKHEISDPDRTDKFETCVKRQGPQTGLQDLMFHPLFGIDYKVLKQVRLFFLQKYCLRRLQKCKASNKDTYLIELGIKL